MTGDVNLYLNSGNGGQTTNWVLAKTNGATAISGNLNANDGYHTTIISLGGNDQLGHNSVLNFNTDINVGVDVLNMNGFNLTMAGFNGSTAHGGYNAIIQNTSATNASTLTLDGTGSYNSFNGGSGGQIRDGGTASLSLIWSGTGTQTLGGNSYTGNTYVTNGTLNIGDYIYSAGSATTATISVSSGATLQESATRGDAVGYGPNDTWIVAGTFTETGSGAHQTLPGNVIMNGGTLTGTSVSTLGTYFANGSTITANGTGNTINATNVVIYSGNLTVNTPLVGDALTISSPMNVYTDNTVGSLTKNGMGTASRSPAPAPTPALPKSMPARSYWICPPTTPVCSAVPPP